jgi:hypothetical protein
MRTLFITVAAAGLVAAASPAWAEDLRPIPMGTPPTVTITPAAPGATATPTWVRPGESIPPSQGMPSGYEGVPGRPLLFPRLGGRLFRRTWTVPASGPVSSAPVEVPAPRSVTSSAAPQHTVARPAIWVGGTDDLQPGMPLSALAPAGGTDNPHEDTPVRTGPLGLIRR